MMKAGRPPQNFTIERRAMRTTLVFLSIIFCFSYSSKAQINVHATLMSRYNWRGIDYGNSPTLLPALDYTIKNFTVGITGAYSFPDSSNGYAENDFWIEYKIPSSHGNVSLLCTDLYFPSMRKNFFNFGNDNGAHTIEIGMQFTGNQNSPVILRIYRDVYNDPDRSSYGEIEFPTSTNNINFSFVAGIVLNKSKIYGTTKSAFYNVGIKAMKTIPVSQIFSFQLSTSWIVNVYHEQSFIIVGIGI
jgi:hypothetical protein